MKKLNRYYKVGIYIVVWLVLMFIVHSWIIKHQDQLTFDLDRMTYVNGTAMYKNYTLGQELIEPPLAYKIYEWQTKYNWIKWIAMAYIGWFIWHYRDWIKKLVNGIKEIEE